MTSFRHGWGPASRSVDAVVEVRELSKRYRARDPWSVQDISFAIKPRHAFGLLGPNGAGKSTVVKIITGLSRLSKGTVAVFGASPRDARVRARIGFASEDPDFPKYLGAGEVLDLSKTDAPAGARPRANTTRGPQECVACDRRSSGRAADPK